MNGITKCKYKFKYSFLPFCGSFQAAGYQCLVIVCPYVISSPIFSLLWSMFIEYRMNSRLLFCDTKYFYMERNILHSSSEETVRNSLHGSGTGQWQISIAGIQIGKENISFSLEWTWKYCDWGKNRNNSQTEWKMVIVIDWVPMCHWKWFVQCLWKEIYATANRFRCFFLN